MTGGDPAPPNIALQPTSPASPSPRLSFRTLGGLKWRRLLSAIGLFCPLAWGCKQHVVALPSELVVPAGATDVTSRAEAGAAGVSFTLHAAFPAEGFLGSARS